MLARIVKKEGEKAQINTINDDRGQIIRKYEQMYTLE